MKLFRNQKFSFFLILVVFLGVVSGLLSGLATTGSLRYEVVDMSDGWTVIHEDEVLTDVSLREAITGVAGKGEVYELVHTLPNLTVPAAALRIHTTRSCIDVYMDDELIYSFGYDYAERGDSVPNGYHYPILPAGYNGSQVRIVLTGQTGSAFSGIEPVYMGNRQDLVQEQIRNVTFPLFAGVFLCLFSLIVLVLGAYLFFFHDRSGRGTDQFRMLFSAAICLDMGIYILTRADLFFFVTSSLAVASALEYITLYMLGILVAALFMTVTDGRVRTICGLSAMLNAALFSVTLLLHALNILHMNKTLLFYHFVVIVEVIVMTVFYVRQYLAGRGKEKIIVIDTVAKDAGRKAGNIISLGMLCLIFLLFADVVRYNVMKYFSARGTSEKGLLLTTVGALVFVFSLLLNYFYYNIEIIHEDNKNRTLENLAYTDALTGCASRTRCEQMLRELERYKGDFSIISLDLNRLKFVNDNLGHAEGDRLLRGFGAMLKACFRDTDLAGRMGGDEFIVIVKDAPDDLCRYKMYQLERLMRVRNKEEKAFQYSVAYGYADSWETKGKKPMEVYNLADERMYEMKERQHKEDPQGVRLKQRPVSPEEDPVSTQATALQNAAASEAQRGLGEEDGR